MGSLTRQLTFEKFALALFTVFFILFVFFQAKMRIRYIGPAIPCLVILSMFGLENLNTLIKRHWPEFKSELQLAANGIVILMMLSGNFLYLMDQYQTVVPMQYLRGELSRDQYIERFRPEYGVLHFANTRLPPDTSMLALFMGNRGYYSEHTIYFNIELFRTAVQTSPHAEDLHRQLVQMGFSHMALRFDMFNKWCHDNLNKKEKQMVNTFLHDWCQPMFSKNGHGLFQLSNQ
jgi:hypothetical protein